MRDLGSLGFQNFLNGLICFFGFAFCALSGSKPLKLSFYATCDKLLFCCYFFVRYSIWVDSKLRLQADPLMIWEKYLWRDNSEYAISQHYDRSCVWEEVGSSLGNNFSIIWPFYCISSHFICYIDVRTHLFNTVFPNLSPTFPPLSRWRGTRS